MKRVGDNKFKSDGPLSDCHTIRHRRKSYYHGKYNKEVWLMTMLLICLAIIITRLGS